MASGIKFGRHDGLSLEEGRGIAHPLKPNQPDSSAREPRKSFGGFLRAVRDRDNRTIDRVYKSAWAPGSFQGARSTTGAITKAAMAEGSGVTGGYIVPLEYSAQLLKVFAEESFLYPRAHVIPMAAAETRCPQIDVKTVQAVGTSPFFGGVKFVWGSEKVPTETEPTFREASLKAWDLLGYATLSNQFFMDIGEEGDTYLFNLLGKAAAWYAEYAFLRGSGSNGQMPLGILNSPALSSVTRSGANLIAAADISGMAAKLLPFSWKNAVWACNPGCLAQIVKVSSYFVNGGMQTDEAWCGTILTRPLYVTEKLPALGSTGDIILFDPSLYVIGQRSEVIVDVSTHPGFVNYQTDLRVWLRLDGKPLLGSTVTLQDGTVTASAYVTLAA